MEMGTGRICNALHGLKPVLLMVVVQFAFAGVNVLYKLAAYDGMNLRILVAYRFIFGTAFLLPIALFIERKNRPKLTWMVLLQGFLSGLFGGSLSQNLYIESLALTSATFASAISQLIPAITFILAITFRLEKLNLRSLTGKAKVVGTLMGIGGAMLLAFYEGVEIKIWSTHVDLLRSSHRQHSHLASLPHTHSGDRLLGCLLAFGSCICNAIWLIILTKMSVSYPCYYSSTALMSAMGSIQAVGFALCMERKWSQWMLGWNIRLLTAAYSGIMVTGLCATFIALCISMRGPLFVSVFNPLMLVLIAIVGSLVLDEKLHLGSVLGAALIVCGLYAVLWGKGKEIEKMSNSVPSTSFHHQDSGSIDIVIMPLDNNKGNSNNIESRTNNNASKATSSAVSMIH
ncbi:WAT1-related protein At1g25270-like [Pyrus x bretschneideri]|uniref:WAT1-related protein At1g25270-like n=1 Tax=Pyrus x bretschneideri TaxID=225117 RepID=UPI00202F6AAE|nr:WAT1-related protein At1g25270-like [Pyrus x bretschneideri]